MLITLVGPNKFAKYRELRIMVGSARQQRILGEDGLARWYEFLGQSDLFGQSPVLVADRIFEDLSKREQEALTEHLTTMGVLTADQSVIFLVDEEKLLNKSRLGSLLSQGKLQRFPKPTLAKLSMWVQQEADRLNVKIDKSLLGEFIQKCGADQFALQTELERWSLHEPAEITADVLQSLMPIESEADTFGLTTAWEQRNISKALQALAALRLQGTAEQVIVGMLGWKVESLLLASDGRQRFSQWSYDELKAAMVSLYQFDVAVKQGEIEPEIGMELWLVGTIGVSKR